MNLATPPLISAITLIPVPFTTILTYPFCAIGTLTVITESLPYTTLVAVTLTNDSFSPTEKFWLDWDPV